MGFLDDHRRRNLRIPLFVIIYITLSIFLCYSQFHYIFSHSHHDKFTSVCRYTVTTNSTHMRFDDPSHTIYHYPEFVCPQNFRNMADWVYGWPDGVFEEKLYTSTDKIEEIIAALPNGSIIYVKTDSVPGFFTKIYPLFRHKFVLITGQGDAQAPGKHIEYIQSKNTKVIHWFAQNADINETVNERFTPIPIGLNCYEMAENIRSIHQHYRNSTLPALTLENPYEPQQYIQPFDITRRIIENETQSEKIALLNFSPDTDPAKVRSKLWKDLCEKNQSSYAICFTKPGGVDISVLPTIYKRNRQYPLWLSPRGNGIDCHRTWEALYLDAIPIVWHSTLDSLYRNLPIIVINDWSEVTKDFLRRKLYEISVKKLQKPSVYQYEKLRSAYWHQLILNKSRYASLKNPSERTRCWKAKINK